MLLAIDIGNTNITMGVYNKDELVFVSRLATDRYKTPDQYAVEFKQIFALHNAPSQGFSGAALSSVVPELSSTMCEAIEKITGHRPMVLGPGIKTGMNILIDNPAQLGADLLAGCIGAANLYPLPCLVADLGTATKILAIDKDGTFRGCTISPGVKISLDALAQTAALLPSVSFTAPQKAIGENTTECMQSGAVYGNAAMLDGMIDRFEEELGCKCSLVATGGIAAKIVPYCRHNIVYDENLLLRGLGIIYRKNKK